MSEKQMTAEAVLEKIRDILSYADPVSAVLPITDKIELIKNERTALKNENYRLKTWVADLQSGMYINCVYCGHRYGPGETTPVSMAEALKEHIEECPEHPMSKLKAELRVLRSNIERMSDVGLLFDGHDECNETTHAENEKLLTAALDGIYRYVTGQMESEG